MTNLLEDLHYSSEHEWVREGNGSMVRIGITEYAANSLGDIVYVSLPDVGEEVSAGDAQGELESTKSMSDLFCPVSGTITAVNQNVLDSPELINSDPYGEGWIFEVEMSDVSELDDLLDANSYSDLIFSSE